MVEKIKLDAKDRKLLEILKENSRYSNSQIAKKIGLSKPAVEYRLQRFEKNKIIFAYYSIIDFTKLGYSQYKLYFKFQNCSIEDEEKMVGYWMRDQNSVWVAQTRGKWDLAVSIIARSNYELGKITKEFLNKYSKFILEKDVLLTEYSPVYLRTNNSSKFTYGTPSKSKELDESDKKILSEISNNARINIVDLAEKTKLTRDVISYRLKKLKEEGVLINFSCYPHLEKINKNLHKLILRTKNFDEKTEQSFEEYCSKLKQSTQFLKLIGSWDLEVEFETESEDELYQIIKEIREKFSEVIRDFDILKIIETFKLNFYPFHS
jgi:DNA-binding Lrp family transcriptional regulator